MGDSITEGAVAALTKSPGDAVEADEVVAQIETDKVTIDVRAPPPACWTPTRWRGGHGDRRTGAGDVHARGAGARQSGSGAAPPLPRPPRPPRPPRRRPAAAACPPRRLAPPLLRPRSASVARRA